jgi:NADH-quinone oxidoreductase subunit E
LFSPELRQRAEELRDRYPAARSALLPLLHLVQAQDGYVSEDGIAECAQLLGLTKAEVAAVSTFYTMYKRAPMGEHLVSVCTNFACKVRGAADVYARLSDKLGVGHNETTADGRFTLEHAECLGNCEGAPVVSIDYLNYECMTADSAEALLDRVAAGDVPPPTRGMVPPGVRQVEYLLAGLAPDHVEANGAATGAASGAATGAASGAATGAGDEPGDEAAGDAGDRPGEEAREEAREQVRDAGHVPEQVEQEGGPHAREFPTTEPDAEPKAAEPGAPAPVDAPESGGSPDA